MRFDYISRDIYLTFSKTDLVALFGGTKMAFQFFTWCNFIDVITIKTILIVTYPWLLRGDDMMLFAYERIIICCFILSFHHKGICVSSWQQCQNAHRKIANPYFARRFLGIVAIHHENNFNISKKYWKKNLHNLGKRPNRGWVGVEISSERHILNPFPPLLAPPPPPPYIPLEKTTFLISSARSVNSW